MGASATKDLERLWIDFRSDPTEDRFALLYEATSPLVYSLCFRLLHNHEDACDAFQAAYTLLIDSARVPRPDQDGRDFQQVLYRLAIREARNLRDRRRRRARKEVAVSDMPTAVDTGPWADQMAVSRELRDKVQALIAQLPEKYQLPIILHFFQGLTQSEIAGVIGKTKMTVSRRIAWGLRQLKPMFARAGLGESLLTGAGLGVVAGLIQPPAALAAAVVFQKANIALASGAVVSGTGSGGLAGLLAKLGIEAGGLASLKPAVLAGMVIAAIATLVLIGAPPRPPGPPGSIRGPESGPFAGWIGVITTGAAHPKVGREGILQLHSLLPGQHVSEWVSPYGLIDLEPGTVYRIRARVKSNQNQPGQTPMWGLSVSNRSLDDRFGDYTHGGLYMFLDNVGGANSAGLGDSVGRNEFEVWYAPPPALSAQWNDPLEGYFTEANRPHKDARVAFSVVDVDGANYGAESDWGMVTLEALEITPFALDDLVIERTLYEAADFRPRGRGGAPHLIDSVIDTRASYAGGALTLTLTRPPGPAPQAGSMLQEWTKDSAAVNPGDPVMDLTTGQGMADNWPVPWEADALYMIEATLSTPPGLAPDHPPTKIRLAMESATQELLGHNYITMRPGRPGAPPRGDAVQYISFFHTHNRTLMETPNFNRLRPRLSIQSLADKGANEETLQTAVTLHGLRVHKVRFDGGEG